jgi:hypothetical protein
VVGSDRAELVRCAYCTVSARKLVRELELEEVGVLEVVPVPGAWCWCWWMLVLVDACAVFLLRQTTGYSSIRHQRYDYGAAALDSSANFPDGEGTADF